MEYELLDTGVFDDDRYFDVEVTYAKAGPDDIVCRITVTTAAPTTAPIHLLPTLWFRNTWSFPPHTDAARRCAASTATRPSCAPTTTSSARGTSTPSDGAELLFCDNESNAARLWGAADSPPFPKDGIADHVAARRRRP